MNVSERQMMNHVIQQFNDSNEGFNTMLKSRFPSLTKHQIRLCNYLKCEMSTKEIAILVGVSDDSIKKAKHRLRKKMDMSPETSFSDFLDMCSPWRGVREELSRKKLA